MNEFTRGFIAGMNHAKGIADNLATLNTWNESVIDREELDEQISQEIRDARYN